MSDYDHYTPRAFSPPDPEAADERRAIKSAVKSEGVQVANDHLRSFIERIERLEEQKQEVADDIKDVYGEAKATGFDTKILRKVIALRKQDPDKRAEQEAVLDSYLAALGMIERDGGEA